MVADLPLGFRNLDAASDSWQGDYAVEALVAERIFGKDEVPVRLRAMAPPARSSKDEHDGPNVKDEGANPSERSMEGSTLATSAPLLPGSVPKGAVGVRLPFLLPSGDPEE